MKILRVMQEIYPYVVGGGAYHAHALSRDQAATGHDVTVLTVSDEIARPRVAKRAGYRVLRYPARCSILGNDVAPRAIRHLLNADSYDVVHAHAHFYFTSNVAALIGRFSGVPVAITNHSLISQSVPTELARLHLRTLGKLTFESADAVLCYTRDEAESLRKLGVRSEISVVSNGVDHRRFEPAGDEYARIRDSSGVAFVFVGRLIAGKRPGALIEAFERVHAHDPNTTLHICGDGPLRKTLERMAKRRGLTNAVVFEGMVPYDRMPDVYRAADVVVLPSRSEGFPRTLLESLSCGTPVVATALDQTRSVVEQAGEPVPVDDTDTLAQRMTELARSPSRRLRLGAAGRDLVVEEGYTWDRTARQTTDVLAELAE